MEYPQWECGKMRAVCVCLPDADRLCGYLYAASSRICFGTAPKPPGRVVRVGMALLTSAWSSGNAQSRWGMLRWRYCLWIKVSPCRIPLSYMAVVILRRRCSCQGSAQPALRLFLWLPPHPEIWEDVLRSMWLGIWGSFSFRNDDFVKE